MKYIVAGYGKFGQLALRRLQEAFPDVPVTVVESNVDRIAGLDLKHVVVMKGDAVSFLLESPSVDAEDIIIPMVPFHLAASFVIAGTPGLKETPLPRHVTAMVPHPFPIDEANLCCSRADFLCPDDCPEGDLCTVTGMPRAPLYEDLEALVIPSFTVLVQRSFQILPGVGGYSFGDLLRIRRSVSKSEKYIVATSCKCHAMMTGIAG